MQGKKNERDVLNMQGRKNERDVLNMQGRKNEGDVLNMQGKKNDRDVLNMHVGEEEGEGKKEVVEERVKKENIDRNLIKL